MLIQEKIKSLRKQKDLSQAQMAAVIGISQAAYAKFESGVTENIALFIATGIAKALNEDFNELFEIESDHKTIAELKYELAELRSRVAEKDLLIKSISNQHRYIKHVLISEVYLFHYNKLEKLKARLTRSTDQMERKEIEAKMEMITLQEKRKYKIYVNSGTLEQSDIDESYPQIKENYEGWMEELRLKRLT